jgi:GxxExxY protein
MPTELLEEERCYSIIGAFLEVFHYFGPGLSEAICAAALEVALTDRGHKVASEVAVPVMFKGRQIGWQRIDRVVDDRVVVELKSTEKLPAFVHAQVVSYLRVTSFEVALLLHAGTEARWKRFVDSPKNAHRRQPLARIEVDGARR